MNVDIMYIYDYIAKAMYLETVILPAEHPSIRTLLLIGHDTCPMTPTYAILSVHPLASLEGSPVTQFPKIKSAL
jgi:hypothetical protein